jgi:hypothetical protein
MTDLITRHGDLFDQQANAMLRVVEDLAQGRIAFDAFDALREVNHQINRELIALRMRNAVLEARCEVNDLQTV